MALNGENNSSASGNEILEVVNEHNEVLGVVQRSAVGEEYQSVLQAEQQDTTDQDDPQPEQEATDQNPIPPDDIHDYDPPPFPDEMFSNADSESDTPDYYLESSEEDEPPIPEIRVPLKNHSRDIEHPEDFTHNWLWLEEDTGASYSQFTGTPGLNIRPSQPDPLGYFHLFFEPAMYTRLADQTNQYARQRIQKKTGYSIFTR